MSSAKFSKLHGAGNDFILLDNRQGVFPYDYAKFLCQRRLSIGADGVILVEHSEIADLRMRIFNADGSEAEMCGNGARCFYRYLQQIDGVQGEIKVQTTERIIRLKSDKDAVAVSMGAATELQWDLAVDLDDQHRLGHHLNTGVPHFVCFVDSLNVDVMGDGRRLRRHAMFEPKGVNVNWVQLGSPLKLRTYERGVEAETLACGTGATAAALAAAKVYQLQSPIEVQVASGDILTISFQQQDGEFSDIWMAGPSEYVYSGGITLPGPAAAPGHDLVASSC